MTTAANLGDKFNFSEKDLIYVIIIGFFQLISSKHDKNFESFSKYCNIV